jgi:hypothetical protein
LLITITEWDKDLFGPLLRSNGIFSQKDKLQKGQDSRNDKEKKDPWNTEPFDQLSPHGNLPLLFQTKFYAFFMPNFSLIDENLCRIRVI